MADSDTWKPGSKIAINITTASNLTTYMYGGNSRSNASVPVLTVNNQNVSLIPGGVYTLDISTEAMLVMIPTYDKNITSFTFTYYIDGYEYNWWQKLIYGSKGHTYFIVALACAGAIALLILISLILVIVFCCCKKKSKVANKPYDSVNKTAGTRNNVLNDQNTRMDDLGKLNSL
jgi:hypothetical protein